MRHKTKTPKDKYFRRYFLRYLSSSLFRTITHEGDE